MHAVALLLAAAAVTPAPPERARRVYLEACASCHGTLGDGRGPAARWLDPRPRDFTRGQYKLRTTASGDLPTDADLLRVIERGVPGTSMAGWAAKLSEADRLGLVALLKGFSPRFTGAKPAVRAEPPPPADDPAVRAEGEALYRLMRCWECHGPHGRGDGVSGKTTKDDWGRKILPADLAQDQLRCGGEALDFYRVLDTGMNGSPMPSFTDAVLVSREAVSDLAPVLAIYGQGARAALERVIRAMPSDAEIEAMTDEARQRLAGRRMWALAFYTRSLRVARSAWRWLVLDTPGRQ